MDDLQHPESPPVAENLREVSDGIYRLVKEHVELAKIEAQASVKKAAFDISLTAAGTGLLLLGWVLLMFACGYALGDVIGNGRAFLVMGAIHVITGVVLVGVFAKRLKSKDKPNLHNTSIEIEHDKHFLHRVGEIMREQPRGARPA